MHKNDLLKLMLRSHAISNNGSILKLRIDKTSQPVKNDLARLVANNIKKVSDFDCLIGSYKYAGFLQDVSRLLNNIRVYYPEGKLDVPASLPKIDNNNIVVFKDCINIAEIKEVVNFSTSIGEEPVNKVALVALFDLRDRIFSPGIDVETVYNKNDLFF